MSIDPDIVYLAKREVAELRAADVAACVPSKLAHEKLAKLYRDRQIYLHELAAGG